MKKNRRDEPIGIIIHIYMEISQRKSLGSYLSLKQAKQCHFFLFSSTKSENRREKQVLPKLGRGTNRRERWWGKRAGGCI
jgi:hypothetical protein